MAACTSRTAGRVLTATLAAGLALSVGSATLAAPVGTLKQFKVPDGVTPAGAITEISVDCNSCILTDIIQGPDSVLYFTSNNPFLGGYNWQTGTFLAPIDIPNSNAVAGDLAVHGDDVWFTDFNNDSLWRYDVAGGQFTQFPVPEPSDVVVDSAGDVWFTAALDGSIARLDPATGAVQTFPVPDGLIPRQITVAADGQIWFTSRFVAQGVGRLDPATGVVATFPTPSNPGPEGIAASPDGTVWFTQSTKGNIARIDNAGVITEVKAVKGQRTVRHHGRSQRRPLVHHADRQQARHTAAAIGAAGACSYPVRAAASG